ncbi:hypothetical protein [Nocardioides sp. WS12]|uniref:hypothetical protein n=1 Tax=Nocardioides sp. WS12 TaxID=2486272 RepID=UPI0015F8B29E|nr:hypothetical protein [Nocardioides sp. WS12]
MARRARRPAPETPALIDLRVLFVAALVASPAAYRASQGLLTIDQALTRFLLVALACTAVSMLLRAVWPVVAGPTPEPVPVETGEISPRPE